MIDTTFWREVHEKQAAYDNSRREIIAEANRALHLAKQAIFALHREDVDDALKKIDNSSDILVQLEKKHQGDDKLRSEGSWSAAIEEFVEASLFKSYLAKSKVGEVTGPRVRPHEYIGGFADYTGELVRYAILQASKGNYQEVKNIAGEVNDAIAILLEYNLTGVLRTKFDQAKKNLRKMEEIVYELSLRS